MNLGRGGLVNLMQVNALDIYMFVAHIYVLGDDVFQIVGYMTIIHMLVGWTPSIGLALIIMASPSQKYIPDFSMD